MDEMLRAIEEGRVFVEHADLVLVRVSGADASTWLNDLVTANVQRLERGETRPSLLLTPTGRIRAAFHVLGLSEREVLLAQPADQPARVSDLLAPYVLSSDVTVETSTMLRLFSLPGAASAPSWAGEGWRPSVLGSGVGLLIGGSQEEHADARRRLQDQGLAPAGLDAVEAVRISLGRPRFPVDLDEDSLPAEAGLDAPPVTDRTKGCFLGQEAVAKVANLGHPTRVVLAGLAAGPVAVGDRVHTDGQEVGLVTSAAGASVILRVRWDARDAGLVTATGVPIRAR